MIQHMAAGAPGAALVDLRGDLLLPGVAVTTPWIETTPLMTGRVYRLTEPALLIGRDPTQCQICVPPHRTDVSRAHAAIIRRGDNYILESRGQNGTFVNGERVNGEHTLVTDDILGLAGTPDLLLFIGPVRASAPRQLIEPLTARERAVLQKLNDGASYLAIAEALCISTNTVKSHIKSLFGKLGVTKATEALNVARRQRLL